MQFRKVVEPACEIRLPVPLPSPFRPLPTVLQDSNGGAPSATAVLPATEELGLGTAPDRDPKAVLPFEGGETAALKRVRQYVWEEDRLHEYKVTRNGLLGSGFSSKFSPWLALGCLSPKTIVVEVGWVVLTPRDVESIFRMEGCFARRGAMCADKPGRVNSRGLG